MKAHFLVVETLYPNFKNNDIPILDKNKKDWNMFS